MNILDLFRTFADQLFNDLRSDETASLALEAESSRFVRWTGFRIRQDTRVDQAYVKFRLQSSGREVGIRLTLEPDSDPAIWLKQARADLQSLGSYPQTPIAPIAAGACHPVDLGGDDPIPWRTIEDAAVRHSDLDLAGLWTEGPVTRAVKTSRGLEVAWMRKTSSFDYSLYTRNASGEPKAVKGVFVNGDFHRELEVRRTQLAALQKPARTMTPGQVRVYLAPPAVHALIRPALWTAFSYACQQRQTSIFREWHEGKRLFHPSLHMNEDFHWGLGPRFNSSGEIAPAQVPLMTAGRPAEFLVSSATAAEYDVVANGAEFARWGGETPRSFSMAPGQLETDQILHEVGRGLWISDVHYTNVSDPRAARLTGMTRFACFWVEGGEIIQPIQDMRFDVSLYDVLGAGFRAATREVARLPHRDTYSQRSVGGAAVPGLVIDDFELTL